MLNFAEWFYSTNKKIAENLWGNIPCATRKPSDGPITKPTPSSNQKGKSMLPSGGASAGNAAPLQAKMKK